MGTKSLKSFMIIVILGQLLGCASTPSHRFSAFEERLKGEQAVDVVIDVFVETDIGGSRIGVDREAQKQLQETVVDKLNWFLSARGIDMNLVYSGYGLHFDQKDSDQYIYIEDNNISSEFFTQRVGEPSDSPWKSQEAIDFLYHAGRYGPVATYKRLDERPSTERVQRGGKLVLPLAKQHFPEFVLGRDNDILFVVHAKDKKIPKSKLVGNAITSAIVTGLLTGGMMVAPHIPSGPDVTFMAFDTRSGQLIWYNQATGNAGQEVDRFMEIALGTRKP